MVHATFVTSQIIVRVCRPQSANRITQIFHLIISTDAKNGKYNFPGTFSALLVFIELLLH